MRFLVLAVLVLASPGWVSFQSVRYHYRVSYPSTWHRASQSLPPYLSDPHEILTVGSGPLPVGGERCAQAPVNALDGVGATGALVSIQERAAANAGTGFPPRPSSFRLHPERLAILACPAPTGRPRLCLMRFRRPGAPPRLGHAAMRYVCSTASGSARPNELSRLRGRAR